MAPPPTPPRSLRPTGTESASANGNGLHTVYAVPEPDEPDDEHFSPEREEHDAAQAVRAKFPRLDWHALWADQTEQEWIHDPLLPARRASRDLLTHPKSASRCSCSNSPSPSSRGEEFLGHKPSRRYRVLYVDFENDPRGDIRTRLQDMGYGPDDLDHLDYLSFPTMAALNSPRGAAELIAAVKAYGSEVVVIDTVSRAIDGEENSNDTWLDFYLHTGLQLKKLGVAHDPARPQRQRRIQRMRGGSAKAGDVDAVWLLTKITDTNLRLECTAHRMQTRHQTPEDHPAHRARYATNSKAPRRSPHPRRKSLNSSDSATTTTCPPTPTEKPSERSPNATE